MRRLEQRRAEVSAEHPVHKHRVDRVAIKGQVGHGPLPLGHDQVLGRDDDARRCHRILERRAEP